MKLGKEEIQKIVLGVLLFFGVLYSYFDMLLGPLEKQQEATQQSITALGPEIANSKAQMDKTKQLEAKAAELKLVSRQVEAMIPDGSPVAWFPTRMGDFFKKQGLDKVSTRMNGDSVDKDLPGFRKLSWGIDLPKVEFGPFARALASLENEEMLIEVNAIQIDASREDVEAQHVLLTVSNIVKQ